MTLADAELGTKVETESTPYGRSDTPYRLTRKTEVGTASTNEQSGHGSRRPAEHATKSRHCDATARDTCWQRRYLI